MYFLHDVTHECLKVSLQFVTRQPTQGAEECVCVGVVQCVCVCVYSVCVVQCVCVWVRVRRYTSLRPPITLNIRLG